MTTVFNLSEQADDLSGRITRASLYLQALTSPFHGSSKEKAVIDECIKGTMAGIDRLTWERERVREAMAIQDVEIISVVSFIR